MKKDRLAHEQYTLNNGIKVFYLPMMDVEIGQVIINIPFGHQNNIGNIPLGGFHFLEHCVLNRSEKFPELDSLTQFVTMNGGYKNGTTDGENTYYEIKVPSQIFMKSFEGLLSHIYEPLLLQEDIDNEKTIIRNERNSKGPFYPGKSESSRFVFKEIFDYEPANLEKIFGDDTTLESMNVQKVKEIHSHYFTNKTTVFLGGEIDLERCISLLETIHTTEISLDKSYNPLILKKKSFFEHTVKETSLYEYYFGYLLEDTPNTFEFYSTKNLLIRFLTNRLNGPIYNWLRREKGWVYGFNSIKWAAGNVSITAVIIPLSKYEQVDVVRKEVDQHIIDGLNNHTAVKEFINAQRLGKVFDYQTLDSRLDYLYSTFCDYGYPVTEEERDIMFCKIEQPEYLLNFYLKLKNDGEFGEFLLKPLS